ncbi:GNAT family N-acetyltransferase [Algibacter luteus]|uniref:GNAT family N-acetyltransferase n=1 Tax=Algibacter luteus TaxID=1178825 RepID=UPI002599B8A9|nr:GNAT family N-acetyltransferase [Algibacter luteus]WJJ96898.1 GNAT family N-acetyltransferase [Algibacter luteus]
MNIATTERLLIKKFNLEDAAFLKDLVNTPNFLKFIGNRNVNTLKEAKAYIRKTHFKSYDAHGFGFYKLILKETNLPIGTCGLVKRDELDDVDIGFAFLEDYERKGYGFEASKAIIKLAKEQFNLNKLLAITVPYNTGSIKLLEKLGFTFEKKIKPFEDDEELLLFAKTLK